MFFKDPSFLQERFGHLGLETMLNNERSENHRQQHTQDKNQHALRHLASATCSSSAAAYLLLILL